MKKIINPVPSGGAPWSNDTIQGVLNSEVWTALEAMLQSISNPSASGNVGVIVSGCVCTLNGGGPNYNCTSGIVYMSGQFMYFPGFSNQALPQYIYPASLITTQKPFYDGIYRNLITEQDASYQSSAPGSGQYIALTTTGNINSPGGYRIENYVNQGVINKDQYLFTTTSGGGTQTAITWATTSNNNITLDVQLIAKELSGGTAGWGSWIRICSSYKNISGTLTLIGNDTIFTHTNDASSPSLSFSISGSNILIQVTPGSGVVYNCILLIKKLEV